MLVFVSEMHDGWAEMHAILCSLKHRSAIEDEMRGAHTHDGILRERIVCGGKEQCAAGRIHPILMAGSIFGGI